MAQVLAMKRQLSERPPSPSVRGIRLRTFEGEEDVERWLEIRNRAFARETVGVRGWDRRDFLSDVQQKSWWRPDWCWFAETPASLLTGPIAVGTVILALRGANRSDREAIPVVHWLSVAPRWRRRGIGHLLLSALEQAAWDAGYRSVALETHEAWNAAVQLYQARGYQTQ
jgi:GNAT superfamily N-acetyltransferase